MSAWSDESLLGWTPNSGDVVVATAGKSGTTWMQQIITQLLAGGSEAALNDFGSLHELSPWVSFRVSSPAVLAARSPEFARAWLATRTGVDELDLFKLLGDGEAEAAALDRQSALIRALRPRVPDGRVVLKTHEPFSEGLGCPCVFVARDGLDGVLSLYNHWRATKPAYRAAAAAAAGLPEAPLDSASRFLDLWLDDFRGYGAPREGVATWAATCALELRLRALSAEMRAKPEWWVKVGDEAIVGRWRAEAAAYAPLEFDWALGEARWLAARAAAAPLARPSPAAGAFETESAVDGDLEAALLDGVAALRREPAHGARDVHPGSDGQVVNHIHPSLYCYVHGVTPVFRRLRISFDKLDSFSKLIGAGTRQGDHVDLLGDDLFARRRQPNPIVHGDPTSFSSRRYQWLPAELDVAADGTASFKSYVNNLHPRRHAPLYRALERLFSRCVPLFESVLAALRARGADALVVRSGAATAQAERRDAGKKRQRYFEPDMEHLYAEEEPEQLDGEDDAAFDERYGAYMDARRPAPDRVPRVTGPFVAPPPFDPGPWASDAPAGRRLQVIVKLQTIELTPERPEYAGGAWHVEGARNERIVATAIHYLPAVRPFSLDDRSRPGRRTIVVFFLVDPTRDVPRSTATVAPQQRAWLDLELEVHSRFWRGLPDIARDLVLGMLEDADGGPMSHEAALAHRLKLMEERTFITAEHGEVFERPFSLCEH
ncbi:DUF4246-containing protein [Aureococcus anophagefferens]|nr:DUF4246-containing protein [Aureococcus anophagefferens]